MRVRAQHLQHGTCAITSKHYKLAVLTTAKVLARPKLRGVAKACDAARSPAPQPLGLLPRRRSTSS